MSSRRHQRSGNSGRKLAAIIAKQMVAVLRTLVNQLNQNASSGASNGSTGSHHWNYKQFKACGPTKFSGSEGATGLLQWFESMENTFLHSECPDNLRVRHASSVLEKRALTWWNGEKQKCGSEVATALTWEEFKELMVKEFCPRSEIRKLETEFWELK